MSRIKEHFFSEIKINSTNRKFYLIFFTIISSFIFLNFFEPFGLYYNSDLSSSEIFVELFVAWLIAFFVLLFSQFVLRNLFAFNKMHLLSAFAWFLLEAVLVASLWLFIEFMDGGIKNSITSTWAENLFAYILIMFIPYFGFISAITIKDVVYPEINETKNNISQIDEIVFKDESGATKLVTKVANVLYIQSSDNYVEIHFLDNNQPSKYLLRNSIKNLELAHANSSLVRCHRSFMINTSHIEMAKKTSSGYDLKISFVKDKVIPVSKTYSSEILKYARS